MIIYRLQGGYLYRFYGFEVGKGRLHIRLGRRMLVVEWGVR